MKKYYLLFLIFLGTDAFSQNRYSTHNPSSNYQAESYSDMSIVPLKMKKKHDENLKYLHSLKDWIVKLKSNIKDEYYNNKLNILYKGLTDIQNKNLANDYENLKKIQDFIQTEIVDSYNSDRED